MNNTAQVAHKHELHYVDQPYIRERIRRMKRFHGLDTDVAIDAFLDFYRDKEGELHEDDYFKRLVHWLKTEWNWKKVHQIYRQQH